jgi:predicted metal-dependent enzyme (double-stranded beta helix superfamily)
LKLPTASTLAFALLPLVPLGPQGARAAASAAQYGPLYERLQGEVLLDNPRVLVQKFVIQPGQSTGRRTHLGDQLLVFVKGGVLSSESGRSTLWRDGRVVWRDADLGTTNAGTAPIEMIWVTLKPVAAPRPPVQGSPPKYRHLNYPNIPGEDLLENDLVIVQRFTVNPGQWEGVHAHHPDMLYIHIKGGQWAARSKHEPEHPYPEPSPDGEVGWMPTIDISVGHESGNIGKEPIDLIWVTLKK